MAQATDTSIVAQRLVRFHVPEIRFAVRVDDEAVKVFLALGGPQHGQRAVGGAKLQIGRLVDHLGERVAFGKVELDELVLRKMT